MLGLSGGALAFSASLISDKDLFIGYWQSFAFHGVALSQTFSIGAAVLLAVNRVRDYGITTRIARVNRSEDRASLPALRALQGAFGARRRLLYYWQSALFLIGAISFILFCLLQLSPVLYAQG